MEGGEPPVDLGRLSKPEADAFRYIAEALGARFAGDRGVAAGETGTADGPGGLRPSDGGTPVPRRGSAVDPALVDPAVSALLDRVPVSLLVVSEERLVFMNRTALTQFGYASAAVVDAVGGFAALFEGGRHESGLMAMVTSSGARFWARVTMALTEWAGAQAILVTVLPAPVAVRGRRGLPADALEALLDANPDPVAVVSRAGLVEACNEAFRRLPGGDGGVIRVADRLEENEARRVVDLVDLSFGIAGGIARSDRPVDLGGVLHRASVGALPGGRLACLVLHTNGDGWSDPAQEPLPPPAADPPAPAGRAAAAPLQVIPGSEPSAAGAAEVPEAWHFAFDGPAVPGDRSDRRAAQGGPADATGGATDAASGVRAEEERPADGHGPHVAPLPPASAASALAREPSDPAATEEAPAGAGAEAAAEGVDGRAASAGGTAAATSASPPADGTGATPAAPEAPDEGSRTGRGEAPEPAAMVSASPGGVGATVAGSGLEPGREPEPRAPSGRAEGAAHEATDAPAARPDRAALDGSRRPDGEGEAARELREGGRDAAGERRTRRPRRETSALAEAVREVRQLVADAAVLILAEDDDGPDEGDSDAEAEFLRLLILSVAARAPAGSVLVARREPGRYVVELSGDAKGPFEAVLSSERIASLGRIAGASLRLSDRGRLVAERMPATLPDNVIRLDAEREAARSERSG